MDLYLWPKKKKNEGIFTYQGSQGLPLTHMNNVTCHSFNTRKGSIWLSKLTSQPAHYGPKTFKSMSQNFLKL